MNCLHETCFNALPRAFFFSTILLHNHYSILYLCFNALPRAFFFSTEYKKPGNKKFNHVSMPYLGLSSFLQLYQLISTRIQLRFNALPRAFFFSTILLHNHYSILYLCFNALPRAFFFSTMSAKMYDSVNKVMFQCPTSGFLLFYRLYGIMNNYQVLLFQCPTSGFLLFYNKEKILFCSLKFVSMPYLGLSSFLLLATWDNSKLIKCFNALPRAFFFSTGLAILISY